MSPNPLMRFTFAIIFAPALLALLLPPHAQAATTGKLVKAELRSATTGITGNPFEVGVLLTMKPGWHTYFSNPGDAGLATRVTWTLPDGYSAGELRFPTPTRFREPGGIVVYGYEGTVLLTTIITPPQHPSLQAPIAMTAKVSWLCCADVCVPGRATLTADLPVTQSAAPHLPKLFDPWNARLPHVMSDAALPALAVSESGASVTFDTHRDLSPPAGVVVIPGAVDGLIVKIDPVDKGSSLTIHAKALKGQDVTAKSLPIYVTYPAAVSGASDVRMSDEFDLPLTPSPAGSRPPTSQPPTSQPKE